MPFGLCNAPGTFQRIMIDIFYDFLRHFLEVFIDEFAVFSKLLEHIGHLTQTFERCWEKNLKLNPTKCFFGVDCGILLGHHVSIEGVSVDLDKILAILAVKPPTTVTEVRVS